MDRTKELEQEGAKQVGGGGEHPFVKWPESRAYVEGEVVDYWESKYGGVFTMRVFDCADHLEAQMGQDEPMVNVEAGQTVNVGLQYSALDNLDEDYVGATLHMAFEGWEESRTGNRYRVFKVFDVSPEDQEPESESEEDEVEGGGPGSPDAESPPWEKMEKDELPF